MDPAAASAGADGMMTTHHDHPVPHLLLELLLLLLLVDFIMYHSKKGHRPGSSSPHKKT